MLWYLDVVEDFGDDAFRGDILRLRLIVHLDPVPQYIVAHRSVGPCDHVSPACDNSVAPGGLGLPAARPC